MMKRQWRVRAGLALVGVLAMLVLVAMHYQGDKTPSGPQASAPAPAERPPIDEVVVLAEKRAFRPAAADPPADTVEHFLAVNRYPATTRRIDDESHDLLNPGARHERRQRLLSDPDDPDPRWSVLYTADRYDLTGDDTAQITLDLRYGEESVRPEFVEMTASVTLEEGGSRFHRLPVVLQDEGARAEFAPDRVWPEHSGPVRVTARFAAAGLRNQSGQLDFHFTGSKRVPAEFTGAISDRVERGDLLFDIGVNVRRSGPYRIEANLFDSLGQPFGWARFEGVLETGQQRVALVFDGLLFHDARAAPPYLLTGLRGRRMAPLTLAGHEQMPDPMLDYLSGADYQMADFRNTVLLSPRQQRLLDMYEDARRRGVRFTEPQHTGQISD